MAVHATRTFGSFWWPDRVPADIASAGAQGAVVYVSGSAEKMPQDVARALEDVAAQHGGLGKSEAQAFVRQLELSSKLIVEAWS